MKVNELEKSLNISRANIRFYEKEGLLKPVRKENNYRDYSEEEVALLKKIVIYRKLGISIGDIKSIFDGALSLDSAINQNINSINNEIAELTIAAKFCDEILKKNVTNETFDTEYYWNEISNLEISGDKFNDFIGLDISGFENKKRIKFSVIIFLILFFVGIIYSLLCVKLQLHDNDYYDKIQPEIDTLCEIDTVKINTENHLLYVCYDRATCVNVYDFDGNFKWAVSLPYYGNSRGVTYFYLDDNKLIIDRNDDAYIYNAINGEFIEKTYIEKLGIVDWRDTYDTYHIEDFEKANTNGFSFDYYNVFNSEQYIVRKPTYYILANDVWGMLFAFIGATGLFLTCALSVIKKFKKSPFDKNKIGKKAKILSIYFKAFSALSLFYTIFNISLSLLSKFSLSLGIMPLAAFLIISLIFDDLVEKKFNDDERKLCGIWRHYSILAFFVAFIGCVLISI